MLYDEVRNCGISAKINDLKSFSSSNAPYSILMIQKIREDLYQIVRQPFLKLSAKEYYVLSTLVFLVTIPPIIVLHYIVTSSVTLLRIHWEILNLLCAIVEPIITIFIAGYFYRKMCDIYEIK